MIDIDFVRTGRSLAGVIEPLYDVVLAENAGENCVHDGLTLLPENDAWDLALLGYQVIDIEYVPSKNK